MTVRTLSALRRRSLHCAVLAAGQQLSLLLLGPLLLAQGWHVRRVTPRLPEAEGARRGEAGAGPLLRLHIIGDSSAAGVGALSQQQALAGVLVAALARDYRVRWQLSARTGATSADALSWLQAGGGSACDVAVTALGVNDVTTRVTLADFLACQREIVACLHAQGARQVLVSRLPPLHRFPALPQPLRWFLGRTAQRFDAALARQCAGLERCEAVGVDAPHDAALMASDGFHPAPGFYALWGEALAARIRVQLGARSQRA